MYWPCIYTVYVYVHIAMHGIRTWCAVYCNSLVSIQNISEVVEYPFSGQFLKEHDVPFLATEELQHETIQANISDKCLSVQMLASVHIHRSTDWLHTHLHSYVQ